MEKYFLSQDDSCHWYLIPVSKRKEWEEWRNLSEDDPASWNTPNFTIGIDGPSNIEFYLDDKRTN